MTPILAQAAQNAEAVSGNAELYAFIIVGAVALGSALAMVLMRNAVHAALMLVVNFFAIAVIYALLEAQFLAVIQLLVYAGAIVVLFLFVLMLLGVGGDQKFTERIRGQKTAAVLLGLAMFAALAGVTAPYWGEAAACNLPLEARVDAAGELCEGLAEANADGNVRGVGLLIFTDYVWPFEATSVLLVIAALGAMVLGKRRDDPDDLVDQPERERAPAVREPVGAPGSDEPGGDEAGSDEAGSDAPGSDEAGSDEDDADEGGAR